ncbi:hypothetical protein [Polaribacter sp. Asnod1-A03]|uniref:hypothetical protein n=1 Tax=Polaribacter sp. Asnod1-A03 TaxID=3160581 RepID=UPI00386B42DD
MKKIFFNVVILMSITIYNAQDLPKIVSPSPEAFEMTKQGIIPIGLHTGTPNYNIPLQAFNTKNLSIPMNLSYSTNGIKVDQFSGNVGLGWNLEIGGVISRVVRGKEDENSRLLHPIKEINKEDLAEVEFLSPQASYSGSIDVDPDIVEFLYYAGNDENADSESDLFSYNILGKSGKIVFNNQGDIRTIPHSNLKVEFTNAIESNFKITDDFGVEYFFADREVVHARTNCDSSPVSPPEEAYTTSWYLTSIKHPNGDEIYFTYDDIEEMHTNSFSQHLEVPTNYPLHNNDFNNYVSTNIITCETINRVEKKQLIKINSNNDFEGSVIIERSISDPNPNYLNTYHKLISNIKTVDKYNSEIEDIDFNYDFTNNDRVFLKGVFKTKSDKNYSFEYDDKESLPQQFSYAQDYWGYYNGKTNNQSLLPDIPGGYLVFNTVTNRLSDRELNSQFSKKGLLTKITYPTKGYTEIEYESNDYSDTEIVKSNSLYNYANALGNNSNSTLFNTFNLNSAATLHGEINVSIETITNCAEEDESNNSNLIDPMGTVNLYNVTDNTVDSFNFSGSFAQQEVVLEHNKEYSLEILNTTHVTNINCVNLYGRIEYYSKSLEEKNILTGGNRVHSIENYDSDSTFLNKKKYHYAKVESLDKSSGDDKGKGLGHVSERTQYLSSGSEQDFIKLSSTGMYPLTNSGSSNVYYKYVAISDDDDFDNGIEEHEFIIDRDYHGETILGPDKIISNFTNFGWSNGLEKEIKYYKYNSITNQTTLIKQITNSHILNSTIDEISNYNITKLYDFVTTQPAYPTYTCKSSDLDRKTTVWQCQSTNHTHKISSGGFIDNTTYYSQGTYGPLTLGNTICRHSNANNQPIYDLEHKCFNLTEGTEVSFPNLIRNLNVVKYKSYSYWYYLKQRLETVYDTNGENPLTTKTIYYYDNGSHLQPTKEETTNSKDEVITQETKYAHEINDVRLIDDHRIAVPLEKETYLNTESGDILLSKQKTIYSNTLNTSGLYLPETIQTSKGTQSLEDRIVYHNYDNKGNPTEVSKKDGSKIYYVWGYQQTQPIAKIEGYTDAELSAAQAKIDLAIFASNDDKDEATEQALRDALQILRDDNNMSNAQVTSFTYDPLIGVTSITDPRGRTVYYEYDDFNRLEYVKDNEGNILSKNQYNYKN